MRTLEMWVRSILFNVLFFLWTLIPPILCVWVVFMDQKHVFTVVTYWQKTVGWLARVVAGIDYRVIGAEHIPEGACIIASKHQSAMETCLLNVLFGNPSIVLKKELTYLPIWGWYAKASGLIPIDRKAGVKAMTAMKKAAQEAKEAGRKIVIFPQGTRVRPGEDKPYKVGVVGLYQQLQLPVVLMALNTGLFWPKGSFLKKKGTVTIEFLPPIPSGLSRGAFMRQMQDQLEAASNKLL